MTVGMHEHRAAGNASQDLCAAAESDGPRKRGRGRIEWDLHRELRRRAGGRPRGVRDMPELRLEW
jgi:hypothetical protein